MKFTMKFSPGEGPDVSFDISKEHLARRPDTMLSTLSKPRWNSKKDACQVIEPVEVADESWSDGTAAAIVAWYALKKDATFELPLGVELSDFVAIADWLLLELGNLGDIEYERTDGSPDSDGEGDLAGVGDGNLARIVRAAMYVKHGTDVVKGCASIREAIVRNPAVAYRFAFFRRADSVDYVNKCVSEPHLCVGSKFDPPTSEAKRRMKERIGVLEDHYQWSQDEMHREQCTANLEAGGLKASNWKKEYLELSGPRGVDFPPMDLEAVRGHRWVLHVTVPPAEPASKRRRRD